MSKVQTFVSLNLRLKDLLGPVTRVKKKYPCTQVAAGTPVTLTIGPDTTPDSRTELTVHPHPYPYIQFLNTQLTCWTRKRNSGRTKLTVHPHPLLLLYYSQAWINTSMSLKYEPSSEPPPPLLPSPLHPSRLIHSHLAIIKTG